MSSFNEIMINNLTDCEKFTRKHLVNMFNKYYPIWKELKHQRYNLVFQVLTKKEKELIHNEIDDEISDKMRKNKILNQNEARKIVLDRHYEVLTPLFIIIYNLHKALPEEIKPTHYACECGSKVVISHKSHHLKTQFHLDFINHVPKEEKQEKTTHYACECGSKVVISHKSHHLKTQFHLDFVNHVPAKQKADTTVTSVHVLPSSDTETFSGIWRWLFWP